MYKEYISILTVKSDKVQLKTTDIFSTNFVCLIYYNVSDKTHN